MVQQKIPSKKSKVNKTAVFQELLRLNGFDAPIPNSTKATGGFGLFQGTMRPAPTPRRPITLEVGGQSVEKQFKQVPAMTTGMTMINGVQSMIVEKTEALATVSTTVSTYTVGDQKFYPGSSGLPWLASISSAFTEYQVLDLEFTYVPSVPTTQAGAFMMAFTGDYLDADPATQADFLQSEQALLAPVYAGSEGGRALQKFGFPPGNVVGFSVPKYTYCLGTTNQPITYRITSNNTFTGYGNTDKNLYSPGKLLFATNGVAGASVASPITVGQLFVRYKLRLLGSVKPGNNG